MDKNYIVLDHCGSEEKVELPDCESVSVQQVIDAVNEQSSWTAEAVENGCSIKLIPPLNAVTVDGIEEVEQ